MTRLRSLRIVITGAALCALALAASADELADAMVRADALVLFRSIGLEPAQAQRMIAPLQGIQTLVNRYRENQERQLEALTPTLTAVRRLLAAGQEVPENLHTALQNYEKQREAALLQLYRDVNREMQAIRDILYPEQLAGLDFTPPPSIAPKESIQERARLQQIAITRIQSAGRMLERIKYLDVFNFITGRTPIIISYLAQYFPQDTPEFQAAMDVVIEYTDRVRLLDEETWRENAWAIAAELVEALGLMPEFESAPDPNKVSWNELYRLFTAPPTLEVVQALAQPPQR